MENSPNTIRVFDVDDTLLFTVSKIKYRFPNEEYWRSCSTEDFSEQRHTFPVDTEYDFVEFSDFDTIWNHIKDARPHIPILKEIDKAVLAGQRIGILTARGNQRAILYGLKSILRWKDEKGNYHEIPKTLLRKKYTFAVGDEKTVKALEKSFGIPPTLKPEDLKAAVLYKIFYLEMGFEKIIFFDDDSNNIDAVKKMNIKGIEAVKI